MRDEYDFSKGERGALISTENKTPLHIYIDNDVMEALRQQAEKLGTGYQTLVSAILKKHLEDDDNISDLTLESQPLNKDHPMLRLQQQALQRS